MNESHRGLRAGDLVAVRSKSEILATLDNNGRLDGMPFMPEMLSYCGQRLRVHKRAHKTCDFVTDTGCRRLSDAVHLEGIRCDGSAHGGCQAECLIFWKEAWLRLVDDATQRGVATGTAPEFASNGTSGCSEEVLWAATRPASGQNGPDELYVCQATLLPQYTQSLSPWDVRQYVEDYRSGNVGTFWAMVPRFIYRAYDNLINLGVGWGPVLRWVYDSFQKLCGGLPYPARHGTISAGGKTPAASSHLQPGELVRVKQFKSILETIDQNSRNRGMTFSAEMVPYCGKTLRVRSRVERIVDEKSGRLIAMKNPCIVLEGGVCQARFNRRMIFCPKATFAYWREIWLERVTEATPGPEKASGSGDPSAAHNSM